jgi:hypothetical protein
MAGEVDIVLGSDTAGLVGRYQRFGGTYCFHLQGCHFEGKKGKYGNQ